MNFRVQGTTLNPQRGFGKFLKTKYAKELIEA